MEDVRAQVRRDNERLNVRGVLSVILNLYTRLVADEMRGGAGRQNKSSSQHCCSEMESRATNIVEENTESTESSRLRRLRLQLRGWQFSWLRVIGRFRVCFAAALICKKSVVTRCPPQPDPNTLVCQAAYPKCGLPDRPWCSMQ